EEADADEDGCGEHAEEPRRILHPIPPEGVDFRGSRDVVAHGGLSAERSVGRWSDRQSPEVTVENQSGAPLHSAQAIASNGKAPATASSRGADGVRVA